MDWLEIIQTVAICINSILLFAIAFMLFFLSATFMPFSSSELDETIPEDDEDDTPIIFTSLDPEQAEELLKNMPSKRRGSSKRRRK